jgi:TatD DNase family protein
MRTLSPVDMHAHVDTRIAPEDAEALQALIFAATRSLDETERALRRDDPGIIWGAGCHPGLPDAQEQFDSGRFARLITKTAYVSEIGIDGTSPVPMRTQRQTLDSVLGILQSAPRIASVHSYSATAEVLENLAARPGAGTVLHWWRGTEEQTQRAAVLGCYFSVNPAMARYPDILRLIPPERLLTETDHPFGDRAVRVRAQPGNVTVAERAISRVHGISHDEIRLTIWRNLLGLVTTVGCGLLLPRGVRLILASVP